MLNTLLHFLRQNTEVISLIDLLRCCQVYYNDTSASHIKMGGNREVTEETQTGAY